MKRAAEYLEYEAPGFRVTILLSRAGLLVQKMWRRGFTPKALNKLIEREGVE